MGDFVSIHAPAKTRFGAFIKNLRWKLCLIIFREEHAFRSDGVFDAGTSGKLFGTGKCSFCGTILIKFYGITLEPRQFYSKTSYEYVAKCEPEFRYTEHAPIDLKKLLGL